MESPFLVLSQACLPPTHSLHSLYFTSGLYLDYQVYKEVGTNDESKTEKLIKGRP